MNFLKKSVCILLCAAFLLAAVSCREKDGEAPSHDLVELEREEYPDCITRGGEFPESQTNPEDFTDPYIVHSDDNCIITVSADYSSHVKIFSDGGRLLLEHVFDLPLLPRIEPFGEDILMLSSDYGACKNPFVFIDTKSERLSPVFSDICTYNSFDKLIAYVSTDTDDPKETQYLVIRDIFDTDVYCKVFRLPYAKIANPVIASSFYGNDYFELTYLAGNDPENLDRYHKRITLSPITTVYES